MNEFFIKIHEIGWSSWRWVVVEYDPTQKPTHVAVWDGNAGSADMALRAALAERRKQIEARR